MKKTKLGWKKLLSLLLAASMLLMFASCAKSPTGNTSSEEGGTSSGAGAGSSSSGGNAAKDIVNIGVTDTLGSLNPLAIDQTEINKYSTAMMFLPLVELNSKMKFEGAVADSITVKNNNVFIIHVDKNAKWSDGQPVTSDDVAFTVTRLCSPIIANATLRTTAALSRKARQRFPALRSSTTRPFRSQ